MARYHISFESSPEQLRKTSSYFAASDYLLPDKCLTKTKHVCMDVDVDVDEHIYTWLPLFSAAAAAKVLSPPPFFILLSSHRVRRSNGLELSLVYDRKTWQSTTCSSTVPILIAASSTHKAFPLTYYSRIVMMTEHKTIIIIIEGYRGHFTQHIGVSFLKK